MPVELVVLPLSDGGSAARKFRIVKTINMPTMENVTNLPSIIFAVYFLSG
jgi:hypothetical protein